MILDFDGVVVESVGIKDQAFRQLYQDFPQHLDRIMEYHLSHNATIRFEKFRYIAENILRCQFTAEMEAKLKAFRALQPANAVPPYDEGRDSDFQAPTEWKMPSE